MCTSAHFKRYGFLFRSVGYPFIEGHRWGCESQKKATNFVSECMCMSVLKWVHVSIEQNYFSGHVRALCPGCRQSPQSLARFAVGGSSVLVVVVSVGEGVGDREGVGDGEWEGEGSCAGSPGWGHVVSFKWSGQNSLIFWYRYHCRCRERPDGGRMGGSWSTLGAQYLSLRMFRFTSVEPALSLTKMHPGEADSNRKWCSFLIPFSFLQNRER